MTNTKNPVALIVGGSSGMGKEVARRLRARPRFDLSGARYSETE